MQSPSWYLRRLSRMSVPEIGHRLGRSLRTRIEGWGLLVDTRPSAPEFSRISEGLLASLPDISSERYTESADRLLAGELTVFAVRHELTADDIDWNRDLLSGISAPLRFGKRIDYRDERLVGNIKYLWEPNRHLEFVTLAQAYSLTHDPRYLEGLGQHLKSWLDQCPYPLGVNWASSLELGIRLINWSIVWQLIGGSESKLFAGEHGGELRRRWLESIHQHVHFIRHYYSRYSSANNHLIGEAAGVFIATCSWPYWKEFEKWGAEARSILITETESQTHADGVNREQAIAYQQFVLDFLILAACIGRRNGIDFPRSFWKTIEQMIEFIQSVMDAAGHVPMIGDADDGFVVRLSQEPEFCPFRSLLATGAILFNRPDFAVRSGGLDDKTRFLLGDDGWSALVSKSDAAPNDGPRAFPHGGYYILGHDIGTNNEIRLVADAGPLGYLSIAAHGHADALSFVLSVAGHEILVDPGTYSYHTQPVWREYFRGTGAHNTVRIDGEDQSVQGGNFMWLRHAQARCVEFSAEEGGGRFVGEHDGYARLPDPVIHRREILQRETMIDVTDHMICEGYHLAERCWHFAEDCQVSVEDSTIIAENGSVRVTIHAEADSKIKVLRGSENPPGGWVSRRFDVKIPSTTVYFRNEIRGTRKLVTQIECRISGCRD